MPLLLAPALPLYVPAAHEVGVYGDAPVQYVPAGHAEHLVAPGAM